MFNLKSTPDQRGAVQTRPRAAEDLIGAQIVFGTTPIGRIQSLQRDPVSGRVRRLIATYGSPARRVAVPMEWVVNASSTRVSLAVGTESLDDLADETVEATVSHTPAAATLK